MTMLKQRHVTSYGTPEQPKGLTNSDFINGYEQIWVSYWVCVPLPSLGYTLQAVKVGMGNRRSESAIDNTPVMNRRIISWD